MTKKRWNKFFFSVLVAGFLLFSFNHTVKALAIGISPSEISEVEVLIGQRSEQYFNLSRSESVGEVRFDITCEDGFIDLAGQDTITFADGENSKKFVFYINATDLALGEYSGKISFIIHNSETQDDAVNKVLYGLTSKISFSVVDKLTEPTTIDYFKAENKDELLSADDFSASFNASNGELKIKWLAKNLTDKILNNIGYDVAISRDGQGFNSRGVFSKDTLSANQAKYFFDTVSFNDGLLTGKYKVVLTVGSQTLEDEFYYHQSIPRSIKLETIILSIGVIFFTIFFVIFFLGQKTAAVIGRCRKKRE